MFHQRAGSFEIRPPQLLIKRCSLILKHQILLWSCFQSVWSNASLIIFGHHDTGLAEQPTPSLPPPPDPPVNRSRYQHLIFHLLNWSHGQTCWEPNSCSQGPLGKFLFYILISFVFTFDKWFLVGQLWATEGRHTTVTCLEGWGQRQPSYFKANSNLMVVRSSPYGRWCVRKMIWKMSSDSYLWRILKTRRDRSTLSSTTCPHSYSETITLLSRPGLLEQTTFLAYKLCFLWRVLF